MPITASDVAALRAATGAGMMDCKKALDEAGGDVDKAGELLRKKGIVKAAKRADKIASEGTVRVSANDQAAVVIEMNSETDFVSQNEDFKNLAALAEATILKHQPADLAAALALTVDGGETLADKISALVAKIGEKITLRRFALLKKTDSEAFGVYLHLGGKIGVIAVLSGTTDANLGRDIAMQAAASNPKYIERSEVPAETLNKEKEVYVEQLRAQKKPENIIENIVKGKLDKFYGEICLPEQAFIKDEEKTVAQYLNSVAPGAKVKEFIRFELGEGMEKKACDFAGEVAAQLK